MDKIKGYRISKCTTIDIESGEDFLPPYYKVYLVEEYNECPTVWYENEFDTLEEAHEYVEKKMMKPVVDKYKKLIEDELFKATPGETVGFCEDLKTYLNEVIEQTNLNKE